MPDPLAPSPLALIIEDDSKLANIFAHALQAAHFETEVFQDGRTALDRLAQVEPAMIILDLHLPYISGKEILRQIRGDERFAQTHIVLATADALMADELEDEADLVLLKPISFVQLRDLAQRLRPH